MSVRPKRFALLDRDGTIIVERNYLSDPDQVELLPGSIQGLRYLNQLGIGCIVVTNQSGIGRGYFDLKALDLIHARLNALLAAEGIWLDAIYFCPHTPEDACSCRKPKTGLVEIAAKEHAFDPTRCFVIGDNVCDVELGKNVGARTILVKTGYGAVVAERLTQPPDFVAYDLWEAARIIEALSLDTAYKGIR